MPSEAPVSERACEVCGSHLRAVPNHRVGTGELVCPNNECGRYWMGPSRVNG